MFRTRFELLLIYVPQFDPYVNVNITSRAPLKMVLNTILNMCILYKPYMLFYFMLQILL